MIALAWTLGSIVAYFGIGYGVAMWDRPHLYDRIRDTYPERYPARQRDLARGVMTATFLAWPIRLPYLLMANAVDKRDPDLLARKIRQKERELQERERQIKELEHKLKI